MDLDRAIKIINLEEVHNNNDELLEAEETFFMKGFGVNVKNKDGTYKSLYDCLLEASEIILKK